MGQDIKARLGGIVVLALGAGIFWFFILLPLQQAQAGAPDVSYSTKAFCLGAILCGVRHRFPAVRFAL